MSLFDDKSPAEVLAEFQRIAPELYVKGDMTELERTFFELTATVQAEHPDESEWIAQEMTEALEGIVLTALHRRSQGISLY